MADAAALCRSAPAIAFAMTYPDSTGFVWLNKARLYDRIAQGLAAEGWRSLAVYPQLTDHPAYRPRHLERHELDLCHATTPAARIADFARAQRVWAVVFMDIHPHQARVALWRKLGVATISSEEYSYDDEARVAPLKGLLKGLRHRLNTWRYDLYVANSQIQRRIMLGYMKLPPARVRTAVMGIDEQHYCPAAAPPPVELGLPVTQQYAVMVCQARPEKRVDFLIEVAAEVFRRQPERSLTFVYVGEGGSKLGWQAKAAELGLGGRFCFAGQQADVRPFFRLASVMLHAPSRESFGFAVAEGMACGLPVLASRRGGPREIIADSETGYLLELDDRAGFAARLLELLDDPPRRQAMGQAARRRVCAHFTLDRQVQDWRNILHEALGMAQPE